MWGINTSSNNIKDIRKSILAILYLFVTASMRLSRVVMNINVIILSFQFMKIKGIIYGDLI